MTTWQLQWRHGQAELRALGGLLGPVTFNLADGRTLQPMYIAPWADEPGTDDLPPLLRELRGELPCVPFGRTDFPEGLKDWSPRDPGDAWEHGYSANQPWSLISSDAQHLRIGIDYPVDSDIRRLERQISADPDHPALDISLTIWVRRDVTLPVALHPTFRVSPQGVTVNPGRFKSAIAYPIPAEPGISHLQPNGSSADLAAMPAISGTIDLTHLPIPPKTEELLQLIDCTPPFSLYYDSEGVEMSLWWDPSQLPDVMLWVSNGGRAAFPWNGRNYALGVEPVNGVFDLGRVAAPPADHPLAARRGLALKKDQPTRLDYRMAAR
nr:hypothetical protein [uncultured Dongia sp.]